jgi:hypothetical protein
MLRLSFKDKVAQEQRLLDPLHPINTPAFYPDFIACCQACGLGTMVPAEVLRSPVAPDK